MAPIEAQDSIWRITAHILEEGSSETCTLSHIDIVSIKDRVKQSVPYSQNV